MNEMSCLPEGVNWSSKEFTKEMLDYMRAVYCMHPMVLDALDYINSLDAYVAELETFIDQLLENAWELSQSHEFVEAAFAPFSPDELQKRIAELEYKALDNASSIKNDKAIERMK